MNGSLTKEGYVYYSFEAFLERKCLNRVQVYVLAPFEWCEYLAQACTFKRLLSWKAIISLWSQGPIGKDTQ